MLPLELEAHPKLDVARRIHGRSDLAEAVAVHAGVGEREPRLVGEIKELAADLQLHGFVKRELLVEGEICVTDAVPSRRGDVPRRVARHLVAGEAEARRIEYGGIPIAGKPVQRSLIVADSASQLIAQNIRTLIAVDEEL